MLLLRYHSAIDYSCNRRHHVGIPQWQMSGHVEAVSWGRMTASTLRWLVATLVAALMGSAPVALAGWCTPETHLAERFQVSADGKHTTI